MREEVTAMKTYNTYYVTEDGFSDYINAQGLTDNDKLLIQIFTALTDVATIERYLQEIASLLPSATIVGATTDGEICSGKVTTGRTVVSLTQFEKTTLKVAFHDNCKDSQQAGRSIATQLVTPETNLIISFTDGLNCSGEEYLNGISSVNKAVTVAGGMAGDNGIMNATYVICNTKVLANGAVGVALCNSGLQIHTSHSFNWLTIGRSMTITKAVDNRVYTIDGMRALDVYKKYLGSDIAAKLPVSGIEFPLIIQKENGSVARAVVAKYDDGSLSFAGKFTTGDIVNFGYGDAEMILERSFDAQCDMAGKPVESIFIYSCMARRRFMPELIGHEITPFLELGNVAGFFTYGEFFSLATKNELMNQTMTVLAISETTDAITKSIKTRYKRAEHNEYQKSINAFAHLLNVTTQELAGEYQRLEQKTELIQAKKESLHQAQEVGHFGSWEIDLISKESIWSSESFRIYKLDPETTKPTLDMFLSLIVDEDKPKAAEAIASAYDGKIKSVELHVRRSDGVIITVLLNGKILFNEKGEAIKMIGTTLDITEQVKLREENEELAAIIEHSSNEVYIVQTETYRYLYVNKEALQKLGYSREEMYAMTLLDINKEMTLEQTRGLEEKLIKEGSIFNRTVHTKKDGTKYPVQSYVQYRKYNNHDVAVILDIDITELVAAEFKQKRQAQILEQIHDSVVSSDTEGVITHWNHGASIIFGYSEEEAIDCSVEMLYFEEDHEKIRWIRQQALLHGVFQEQLRSVTKSGEMIYIDMTVSTLKDENGTVVGITCYAQDITQRKEIEEKLYEKTQLLNFQAYHDPLTQLPNRALFDDRLQQSIANAHRHNEQFGLLFIDLDNFKRINDTLGHHIGDAVLQVIAQRLSLCIREDDTLSRLGGDEFTILVQNLRTSESAARIAQTIIDALKPKMVIDNHELHISASIGISLYPKDSILKNDLLKYADSAMYTAKDMGRNNFQFYSAEMTQLAFEKAAMESSLHRAIEKEEFVIYYQPQIDARNNRVIGMEALVRWVHPEMGLVMPDKFIPLAEETGFVKELDNYVMHQAMKDMVAWQKMGLNPGKLSLNLSIKQLASASYVELLKETMYDTGFNVAWLELEITESQMMLDPMRSIDILQTISDMGIEISIDDFGTGYSSLAYLKRLPVDKLKIDRSFIQELPYDDEDRAISNAIIALAESLNLSIIAEGVENSDQITYLLSNGCHMFQGYYYSKAIDREAMTDYLMKSDMVSTSAEESISVDL